MSLSSPQTGSSSQGRHRVSPHEVQSLIMKLPNEPVKLHSPGRIRGGRNLELVAFDSF